MEIPGTRRREEILIGALLLASFLVTGCTGMTPYEPRDDRVEGPKKGLLSGEAGEFVIYRR
jgi:hypothetical protein